MGEGYARTFAMLRPYILARLVDVREAIDHRYAAIPDEIIRDQFDRVLDRMQSYLEHSDAEKYRSFANRWVAMRMGEGFAAENVIHSLVALADVVVQVSQQQLGASDGVMGFVRAVTQMNFLTARMVVESLGYVAGDFGDPATLVPCTWNDTPRPRA
jgi:hypothetical protein